MPTPFSLNEKKKKSLSKSSSTFHLAKAASYILWKPDLGQWTRQTPYVRKKSNCHSIRNGMRGALILWFQGTGINNTTIENWVFHLIVRKRKMIFKFVSHNSYFMFEVRGAPQSMSLVHSRKNKYFNFLSFIFVVGPRFQVSGVRSFQGYVPFHWKL